MGEYADLFDETPQANLALRFGIENNPDQAAEAARLARRYRLPIGVVKEFREDYKAKAQTDDAKIVVDKSPVLRSWIAKDQQNADISHDDVGNLSAVASAVRMAGSFGEGVVGQGGVGSVLTGLSKLNEIAGRGIGNVLSAIGGEKITEALQTEIPWWLDPTKVLLERPGQALKDVGRAMAPEQKLFREDVAGGLGQFAGQAATALLTGGTATSATMFAQGVDAMSEKVANDPTSQENKDSAALIGAGVTAITEKYALDRILGPMAVPIKNAIVASLARIGIGAATEGAQEMAESIGQDVARMLLTDSDAKIDALSTAYEGGVGATVGGIARSMVEAALHVKRRGDHRTVVAAEAEQTKESLQNLDALAKASKVRERDAVTFEQFVEHASEDGPVQDVFISGEALLQSGLLNQLAQVSPAIAEQAQTAAATGGDVRIPIAEYASRIAGTDLSAPLLDHLKTSPNGMSQAEAKEYIKDQGDRLKAEVETALGESDRSAQMMVGRDAVQAKVLEKLAATNRFTPDANTLYAQQMANFFAIQAQRIGTTPESLFAQYEPRVVAESVDGPSLAQDDESRALQAFSQQDELFALPKSEKTSIKDIAAENNPGIEVGKPLQINRFEEMYTLTMPDGAQAFITVRKPNKDANYGAEFNAEKQQYTMDMRRPGAGLVDPNTEDVWVDVSRLKEGGAGSFVYNIAATFAHNTGRIFIGDPSGVSSAAMMRRPENMLSSALKFGTTRHIAPHPDQVRGKDGVPALEWVYGDDVGNVRKLIDLTLKIQENAGNADALSFDPATGQFTDPAGGVVDVSAVPSAQRDRQARAGKAGSRTLARNAIFRAVLREQGQEGKGSGQLLARAMALASKSGASVFYQGGVKPNATFSPDTRTIALLKGANLSSFLHESGHFYLEVLADLARTNPVIRQDMDAVLKWFGITGSESVGKPGSDAPLEQAGDQTQTEAFKSWFGDSKVVDESGRPIVVYHGTSAEFDSFDLNRGGQNWPDDASRSGVFFSEKKYDAEHFAAVSSNRSGGSARVVAAYLSLLNPKIIDDAVAEKYRNAWLDEQSQGDQDERAKLQDQLDMSGEVEKGLELAIADAKRRGHDGAIVRVGSDPQMYVAFDSKQIKSAIGNRGTFDPNNPGILNQGGDDGAAGPLPAGRTPFETWELMTLDEKRPYHEKFARGFESYLFEGKAPSPEMGGMFARFRAWMVSVYKSIKALNVELTDEVRGVFDRMLATPDQIEAAQASREMGLMFASEEDARKFGVDWAAYQAKGQKATEQAVAELDKRSLADMQWLSNAKSRILKELQKRNDGLRKEVGREVRSEVMARPVYRVWSLLTAKEGEQVRGPDDAEAVAVGRAKLNTEELKERYGVSSDADWRKLSALRMTSPEGVSPDSLSEQIGFTSGDEMVKALIDAVPPQEVIKAETDQRMLERYGDITSDEALAKAVDEAVHNDMRQRVVADELAALEKAESAKEPAGVDRRGRQRSVRTLPKAAKEFAQNLIASIKIRDLRPAQYSTAAARAGVMAMRALKKNDIAEAAKQKRNQLIQGYASKAASQAQEEVSDSLGYLRKVEKSQSIDQDYKDQIDTILERFDLKRGTSLKTIDKRKALSEWIAQQEEIGISPDLPAEVANEALRKSYKEMTVEEFRGLVDSVKQIEHLGRLKKKLLTAKDKRDFEAARDELVASIESNAKTKVDNRTRDTLMSGALRMFKGFLASHRKTASLAKELDGFKDGGPMWEYLVRTMNEAGDTEAVMREKAAIGLTKILKPILRGPKLTGKGQFFSSVGLSLNRGERIVMALNTGNAGNLQRLLDGRGWTLQQIQPVLDTLTESDWQAVQAVWDFFEGYRPLIAAKERRVMGTEPDWVEPVPVVTKFGTFRGGYYPVKYDPRESGRAENFANAEQAKQELKGAFVASTTRRSFTKTRVEEVSGRPLLLTMDAIFSGANEVIHDLSWHEWVIDANRILRNDQIDKAIRDGYGADTVANLKQAVKDIAAGEATQADALSRVLSPLRAGATIAGLGLSLTNAMLQPLGLTQSMVRIGTRWVGLGIAEWAKSPVGLVRQVHAKSDFMRLRAKTQQRELNEIASVVKGKSAARVKLDTLMFVPMTSMQLVADMPTWWGAYQKALANGDQEERAIEMADQAVIDAQGGGQVKDLSAIQRGGPLLKLFTTFYGYFNVAYNLGVERAKATNYRNPLDVMHLAWDFLLLYSAPAVLATLLKESLTGGGDDDEALARKVVDEQISFLMGTMVGLREATGALQYAAGTKQFDMAYGGPAGLRFVQELDKLGKQIGQGELDRALARAGINVAGVVLHLPSGQVNKTIDGVIAISEGKTENPSAILFGPPKE